VTGGDSLGAEVDLARTALALARRFAAGATLWCLAPEWPHHGRHLAVEFVHPVVVGKRALPALSVAGTDPVADLRVGVRPGDVLAAIAPAGSVVVADAVRRAPAWGVTTVWLGAGPLRPTTPVDHLVWIDDDESTATYDGRLVVGYHVLWELTHVCFEHPGLLTPTAAEACDLDGTCITCSDEGLAAEVIGAGVDGLVEVRTARGPATVDATLVGPVAAGDLLLVHAGTAIERLDQR
jgi:hypothetical protein